MDYTLTCKAAKDCHPVQKKKISTSKMTIYTKKVYEGIKEN